MGLIFFYSTLNTLLHIASWGSYFYPLPGAVFLGAYLRSKRIFSSDPVFVLITLFLGSKSVKFWSGLSKYSIRGSLNASLFITPGEFIYFSEVNLNFFTLPASDLILRYFIRYSSLSCCFFKSVLILPYIWIFLFSARVNIYFTFLISTWPWLK